MSLVIELLLRPFGAVIAFLFARYLAPGVLRVVPISWHRVLLRPMGQRLRRRG